jgi:hypothetical protein
VARWADSDLVDDVVGNAGFAHQAAEHGGSEGQHDAGVQALRELDRDAQHLSRGRRRVDGAEDLARVEPVLHGVPERRDVRCGQPHGRRRMHEDELAPQRSSKRRGDAGGIARCAALSTAKPSLSSA